MDVISFRGDEEHSLKLDRMAQQTGWNVSQILRHLVEVADVAPVTFVQTQPVIKNTGTPGSGAPAFYGRSGTRHGAG